MKKVIDESWEDKTIIAQNPCTEIAGTWPEVKREFIDCAKTKSDIPLIEDILREIGRERGYKDNSLLTVEWDVFDLVVEVEFRLTAVTHNSPDYGAIVNTKLSDKFRSVLRNGDMTKNTALVAKNLKAEVYPILTSQMAADEAIRDLLKGTSPETIIIWDICCSEWFKSNPENAQKMIEISADTILEKRGLLKQPGGSGRRGGYRREQREEIERHLMRLTLTMISVDSMPGWRTTRKGQHEMVTISLKSPPLLVEFEQMIAYEDIKSVGIGKNEEGQTVIIRDSHPDDIKYYFQIKPGAVFAPYFIEGVKEYAQINSKVWGYDPVKNEWEIAIAYYFSRLWRIRAYKINQLHKVVTVGRILQEVGREVDKRYPKRTRDRFEKAMDRLKNDGIISGWKYKDTKNIKGYKWVNKWLNWKVEAIAPKELVNKYAKRIPGKDTQGQDDESDE